MGTVLNKSNDISNETYQIVSRVMSDRMGEFSAYVINMGNNTYQIIDHMGGFDASMHNEVLAQFNQEAKTKGTNYTILYHQILNNTVHTKYPFLNIKFSADLQNRQNFVHYINYTNCPKVNIKNFICSFNGSAHISRQLLTSILNRMGLFNPNYCSKNFTNTIDEIDGHIMNFCGNDERFYRKFFVSADSSEFLNTTYTFGHNFSHNSSIHSQNVKYLENKLTDSFLHIVGETMGTSCHPFITEKFLYSIVTRSLFLSYAQSGWHQQIDQCYGFKLYTKLFNYRFDSINNPVERLVALIEMIYKFKSFSNDELYDLYLTELDTINYNYDHYFSGAYLKKMKEYE